MNAVFCCLLCNVLFVFRVLDRAHSMAVANLQLKLVLPASLRVVAFAREHTLSFFLLCTDLASSFLLCFGQWSILRQQAPFLHRAQQEYHSCMILSELVTPKSNHAGSAQVDNTNFVDKI